MLIGAFAVPGGPEWLVIIGVIVLLFVPSIAIFLLGYAVGRKSAPTGTPGLSAPAQSVGAPAPQSDTLPPADGESHA
jgi:hypothetical protein